MDLQIGSTIGDYQIVEKQSSIMSMSPLLVGSITQYPF